MVHYAKPGNGRFKVRYVPGQGYGVFGPDEVQTGTWHRTNDDALTACGARNAAAKRVARPCMCCRQPFASEGIHNRMCGKCRLGSAGEQPAGIMVVKRRAHS